MTWRSCWPCGPPGEAALITHLQEFPLELGNGFSFVARQQRLHGHDFFVDLVFYNQLLQCFVLGRVDNQRNQSMAASRCATARKEVAVFS